MCFIVGTVVGAAIMLAVPVEKKDWLIQKITNQWQKITKKG